MGNSQYDETMKETPMVLRTLNSGIVPRPRWGVQSRKTSLRKWPQHTEPCRPLSSRCLVSSERRWHSTRGQNDENEPRTGRPWEEHCKYVKGAAHVWPTDSRGKTCLYKEEVWVTSPTQGSSVRSPWRILGTMFSRNPIMALMWTLRVEKR